MSLSEVLARKHARGICSECRGNAFAIKQAIDEAIERCAAECEYIDKHVGRPTAVEPGFFYAQRIRALKSEKP